MGQRHILEAEFLTCIQSLFTLACDCFVPKRLAFENPET